MPLGKYYCDYCDKQFQDTPFARRRHLQGIQHLRAKDQWYNSLRATNPNQAYQESFGRGVCNRFVNTGFCQYGDSCKYFHPKSNFQNLNGKGVSADFMDSNQPSAFQDNQLIAGSSVSGDAFRDRMGLTWENLPPSLRPPPEGGYAALPFVDWG